MKRTLLVLFMLIAAATYINAQNEITGFLGIKLEDKPYVAIDKLKDRFPNVKWEYPCIKIENISFLGQQFNSLVITYKDEKLTEAVFTLRKTDLVFQRMNQDMNSFLVEGQAAQSRIANLLAQLYSDFATTLFSKYGEPTISSERNAIWKDINSNSITLSVTYNTEHNEILMGAKGNVTITYRTSSTISNDEF